MSVPGKVFLLGEYAVLAGQPAIVAAVGPRFRWSVNAGEKTAPSSGERRAWFPHPDSPTGRLLARYDATLNQKDGVTFYDPHDGRGGFGGSTAEFAFAYRWLAREHDWPGDWVACWKTYQALFESEAVPPSGADLAVQVAGGIGVFDPLVPSLRELMPENAISRAILVFSAVCLPGRKVATHEHLRTLPDLDPRSEWIGDLSESVAEGIDAWARGSLSDLGRAVSEYAVRLNASGLESEGARADRTALAGLEGVYGVKGAGAMLADALLAIVDPARHDDFIEAARARGLRLVSRGIPREEGIRDEPN